LVIRRSVGKAAGRRQVKLADRRSRGFGAKGQIPISSG
jgi:hypothetical protein